MHIPHLSASPRVPCDRFGQPLSPGDLVVFDPDVPQLYRVTEIRPASGVDPRTPPDQILVTLTCVAYVNTRHGQPIGQVIRVGYEDGPNGQPMIGSPYRHPVPGPATRDAAHDGTVQHSTAQDGTPGNGQDGPIHLVPAPDKPA